jgi:hypothetical protein
VHRTDPMVFGGQESYFAPRFATGHRSVCRGFVLPARFSPNVHRYPGRGLHGHAAVHRRKARGAAPDRSRIR